MRATCGLDLRQVASTAARLHRNPGCGNDVSDDVEVAPVAEAGAVEIDQMQPGRTGFSETARERDRVRTEIGDAGEIALLQPYRAPAKQVDRRDDQHPKASPSDP